MWKRLSLLWSVIRGDARLLWFALRHPLAPRWLKPAVAGVALYLLSPRTAPLAAISTSWMPTEIPRPVRASTTTGSVMVLAPSAVVSCTVCGPGLMRWRYSGVEPTMRPSSRTCDQGALSMLR